MRNAFMQCMLQSFATVVPHPPLCMIDLSSLCAGWAAKWPTSRGRRDAISTQAIIGGANSRDAVQPLSLTVLVSHDWHTQTLSARPTLVVPTANFVILPQALTNVDAISIMATIGEDICRDAVQPLGLVMLASVWQSFASLVWILRAE